MKRRRLVAAIAAVICIASIGAGTAAATGFFSRHHGDSTERALAAVSARL